MLHSYPQLVSVKPRTLTSRIDMDKSSASEPRQTPPIRQSTAVRREFQVVPNLTKVPSLDVHHLARMHLSFSLEVVNVV
jgi:hypothetical protein